MCVSQWLCVLQDSLLLQTTHQIQVKFSLKMARLSDEEIVAFLKKMLAISVSRDDLARPTSNFVMSIYGRFLEEFGFQSLQQPDIMACSSVPNIEYMGQIITQINIFKAIQKYLVGIDDFCLQDILHPKRNQTHKIISSLCAFYLKFIDIKKKWLEIKETSIGNQQKIVELDKRNLELKHLIEEKSMVLGSLKSKSVGLDKQLSAEAELCSKKEKESNKQLEQFKQTKKVIMKVREDIINIDVEISKKKELNKELEEIIVKSPQRSIQETENLEKLLEKKKLEVENKKKESLHINKKLDCHKTVFNSLQASTEDISALLIMLSDTDHQCENLENIKQDALNIEEEIKSIDIKIKELQATKQGWQGKRNHTARQYSREFATLRELNDGLQQSVKQKEAFNVQLQSKAHSLKQEKANQQNQCDQLDEELDSFRNQYYAKRNAFLEKFKDSL